MSRPFDGAHYRVLLKGLDVTVTTINQLRIGNEKFRIDDGYFCKEAVLIQQRLTAIPHVTLGEVCSVFRKGIFDIKADSYTDVGVPFVRIGDLRKGLIDRANVAFIPAEVHREQSNTALEFGDIALSKTAYPAASFISVSECNVSQDVIAVKIARQWHDKIPDGFHSGLSKWEIRYRLVETTISGQRATSPLFAGREESFSADIRARTPDGSS